MDPRQQQIEAWMEIKIQAEYQIKKLQESSQEQKPGGMSIPADHFTEIQQSLLKREKRIQRQIKPKS